MSLRRPAPRLLAEPLCSGCARCTAKASFSYLEQHFSHRPLRQPLEGFWQPVKGEDAINEGSRTATGQQGQNLLPRCVAFNVGVGADGHPAQADSAEQESGGVEAGDRAGQPSDNAYLAKVIQRFDYFGQEFTSDVVNCQVHAARRQSGFQGLPPLRFLGIKRQDCPKLPEAITFFGVSRESDDLVPQRGGELHCRHAHAARGARDQHDRRRR